MVVLDAAPLHAEEPGPDLEIAQRHFARGSESYAARDYQQALKEFEAAHKIKPLPTAWLMVKSFSCLPSSRWSRFLASANWLR